MIQKSKKKLTLCCSRTAFSSSKANFLRLSSTLTPLTLEEELRVLPAVPPPAEAVPNALLVLEKAVTADLRLTKWLHNAD